MNEENTEPLPEQPAAEPAKVDRSTNRGFLERLPKEVREDMDTHMRAKNPSATRKYMIEKYTKDFPQLAALTKVAFYNYEKKFKIKEIDLALKTQVMNTPPELLAVIENFTDANVSLVDKKAALVSLFKDCSDTSKRLELSQQNFLDPQMQMVILQNRKQMVTIIEKIAVLKNQLDQDSSRNLTEAFEEVIQVCLAAVVNSYKVVHQDQSLYSQFMADLLARLKESTKTYRTTKEAVKQAPIKIN
jgi:hypothetical protein